MLIFLVFSRGVLITRLLALHASVAALSSSRAAHRAVRGRGSCYHVLGDLRSRRSRHGDVCNNVGKWKSVLFKQKGFISIR
jgi:hypothetical protein